MKEEIPLSELDLFNALPMLSTANTSVADYFWLPLRFEDDDVKIDWFDTWSPDDYE